ncbi:MAG TPA: twin-arginine translocation signal domain-containing protein, partial [Pyrinomonadaceae bacterium]|nr:twin-arginine translocation signal domain-containing protein [Pyrinomonadaceae bacterium]
MKTEKQSRRDFLKSSALGVAAISFVKNTTAGEFILSEPHAELNEITVLELQAGMKSGKFSAKTLVEMYLARIREIDPKLN